MSWCGGGEIRPTPGVLYLVLAIHGYTLLPGSWPPSPGLAPWAILICRSSALTRYSLVTPNLPLATCFTAERRRSPLASGGDLSGAGPPGPPGGRCAAGGGGGGRGGGGGLPGGPPPPPPGVAGAPARFSRGA